MTTINWVCRLRHGDDEITRMTSATVTRHQSQWAFCVRGGNQRHSWQSIVPTDVFELRLRTLVSERVGPTASTGIGGASHE